MRLGLAPGAGFTVGSLDDLDRYLGAIADAGFGAVSLSPPQLAGDPVGAARLLDAHGLVCTDLISLRVDRDDEASTGRGPGLAPLVDALGGPDVLTMLWTRVSDASLDRLARCADLTGTRLALEFAPGLPADSVASARDIATAVGDGRVGVLADAFHLFRGPSTLAMVEAIPLADLPIVQFTDALPAASDDYMAETTGRRAMPGDGELDLAGLAGTLLDRRWDGVVSVEVLSSELRQLSVEEFARRAYGTTAPYWRAS